MTQRKTTKRALFASILSLLLCVSMLIGSTFAWFTDTASTGVNKIQSGKLDVVLEMSKDGGTTWTDAEGETLDFIKAAGAESETVLWEPGAEYKLPMLRIKNNGNLALKFKVVVNGLTGDMELADVLDVYVKKGDADKEKVDTLTNVMALNDASISGMIYGNLEKGTTTEAYEVSLKMQETAGNEYQDLTMNGIAITVYATQYTVESDSYSKDYDEKAYYSDAAQAVAGKATTLTAGTTTVEIPADGLTEGTVAQLKVVGTKAPFEVSAYDTVIVAKDISIVDANGATVTPNGTVKVTMNIGAGLEADKIALYHNSTEVTAFDYNAATGILSFSTDSFSPFTVLYKNVATIDSAEKLAAVRDAINADENKGTGVEINLAKNIDLAGANWTPIKEFAGTFDGQGFTISNLAFVYENSAKDTPVQLGLFDTVAATGIVKNLTLANVSADLTLSGEAETSISYYRFGSIAAVLNGKAEDCVVKNVTVVTEGQLQNSGGVFGKATDGAVIDGCSANGVTITVTDKFNKSGRADCIGGFIGVANSADANNKVKITDCSATDVTINNVYKTRSYGGFVGCTVYTEMENCTATNVKMNIDDYYQQVGGFVGYSKYGCVFKNCDVNGIIMNLNNDTKYECYAGGFVGHTDVPKAELSAVPDDQEKIVLENCDVKDLDITVSGLIYGRVSGFCGWTTGYGPTLATNCSVAGSIDATDTTIPKPESAGVMEIWRSLHTNDAWTNSTANVTIMK